jgi:hypothetical protein
MFRSALSTGALPALDEETSWLPVDECARTVAELALGAGEPSSDVDLVYHLVNPRTFSWKHDLLPALKQGSALPGFGIVSPLEWLQKLAGSEQDPGKNPSIKLFDFWRSKYAGYGRPQSATAVTEQGQREKTQGLTFETHRTVKDCSSLALVKDPVTEGLILRYIESWMKRWTST